MQTKIKKWGNSLGIRIPKNFAQEAGIQEDSEVDLTVEDGELVIRPRKRPTYSLKSLLKGVTKKNLHSEIDSGDPIGNEVW